MSLHIPQRGKADFAVFAHFGQGSIGSLCRAAGGEDIIDDQDVLAGKIVCSANAESVGHIGPFVIHLPSGLGAGVAAPFKDIAPEMPLRLILSEEDFCHTLGYYFSLIVSSAPLSQRMKGDWDNVVYIRKRPLDFFAKKPSHIETESDISPIFDFMDKCDIMTFPGVKEEWNHPVQIGPYPEFFLCRILRPIPIVSQGHILHTIFTDIPLIPGQQPSAYLTLSRKNQIRQTFNPFHTGLIYQNYAPFCIKIHHSAQKEKNFNCIFVIRKNHKHYIIMEIVKEIYQPPFLEVQEIEVEKGFATSIDDLNETPWS